MPAATEMDSNVTMTRFMPLNYARIAATGRRNHRAPDARRFAVGRKVC
jgi:hypothetical protein